LTAKKSSASPLQRAAAALRDHASYPAEPWEEAARAFRDAAAAGQDLTRHVSLLEASLLEATHIGVVQSLADALAIHWMRAGNTRALQRALKATRYPDYLLNGV